MQVDWTKEVIDLETGEVMRVLCTDAEGKFCVVMMNKNKSLRYSEIDGSIVNGKQYYGNRKPDSEPPEEIFNIWSDGYLTVMNYTLTETITRFNKSKTYKDWKNKKITVEDV